MIRNEAEILCQSTRLVKHEKEVHVTDPDGIIGNVRELIEPNPGPSS